MHVDINHPITKVVKYSIYNLKENHTRLIAHAHRIGVPKQIFTIIKLIGTSHIAWVWSCSDFYNSTPPFILNLQILKKKL